jgi:serine/threonine-protein kinase
MFGPYRIEELLGRGGMGEVYRAHDTETDREVALKLLPGHLATDAEYQERFRRECRVAARLTDPHVVPIHRFGEIDGRLYLDMRLVAGTDLGAWLADHGPLPPDVTIAVIGQVASALDAAHAAGLVHRDVKPSNVLLAGVDPRHPIDPNSVFAYLFDFGIARARDGSPGSNEAALTRAGTMPGSLAYVAPERYSGVEGDPRADVYALACVLFQSLTGRPPYEGDLPALMRAHLHAPPPRPSAERPGVPPALDEIVARGMAKDPNTRYQTAGALAAAARAAVGATTVVPHMPLPPMPPHLGGPPPESWSGPSQPRHVPPAAAGRRNSWAAYTAIGVAVVTVIAGVVAVLVLTLGGRAEPPPTPTAAPPSQTPPSSSPSPSPTSAPTGTAEEQFFADLPRGFSTANCTPNEDLRGAAGVVAGVVCNSGPPDGPGAGTFTRYTDRTQVDQAFGLATDKASIPAQAGTLADCRTAATVRTTWVRGEEEETGGEAACYTEADGSSYLLWSDYEALAIGYVVRSDGNANLLFDWWQSTDFGK